MLKARAGKQLEQIIAVDLGARVTKAAHVHRRGDKFELSRFAIHDAPISEKGAISSDLLAEHLRTVVQSMDARVKTVTLAVGAADTLVRHVEMPEMPVDAMRMVLKNNSRNYLQQDLPNHVFDCHLIYQAVPVGAAGGPKKSIVGHMQRLLVSGARQQYINDLSAAGKAAGLNVARVIPGLVCPANSFELALPEVFANEIVALVEIGYRCSTVCILQQGELVLTRVVNLGGDRLTAMIAEDLKISYAEAEGIKIGMPDEIRSTLEAFIAPLGRELRASIDFFEHQQDKPVSKIFVSGGTTRSPSIVQLLQSELMAECNTWNPASFIQMALPPIQTAEIEQVAPQLGVALGAAVAAL